VCKDEGRALTLSLICDPETSDLDLVHVAPNAVDRGMLRHSGHPTHSRGGDANHDLPRPGSFAR
jgi:hypothetical protein